MLAAAVLLLGGLAESRAQGFNTLNGRNHPELDWQVAETAHFKIMYPKHLAGIEAEAAPIAEATYDALSENLGVSFDQKIRLYLSDEDEISNGFAAPVGEGYTNIWVHTNDWAATWTGPEKWLRKVVAHEVTHLFHYRAVASRPAWLNFLFGDPLPRFWTEGLAQYETESWDAQRGDRWLRTSVLDDRLSYDDGRSLWNGRLLYAVGNAQVRFFAQHYGDSTLARLLAHRQKTLLGLARVHRFDTAFKAVTDASYRDFYDDWRRHVNVYYNTMASRLETVDSLGAGPLEMPGQYLDDVQFSPDTTRLAVLSVTSLERPVRRLYVVDRETKRTKVVTEGPIQAPVAWSPDGRRLAFARTTRGRHASLLNDLYLVDADGRHLRRLTHSRRAFSPTFSPDGRRLAFVGSAGGTANVFVLDLETGRQTRHTPFTGDVQISGVRWHPAQEKLVFARIAEDGTRDLVLLDLEGGALRPLTDGATDDRMPVWSPDGRRLAFTSLRDEVPNVFVLDLDAGAHRRVTRLATGAWAHGWLPPDTAHAAGTLVLVSNVTKERDRAYRIDAARAVAARPPVVPEAYAAWTHHRPPREVPRALPPDSTLIQRRYAYRAWPNLTHALTGALPYYGGPKDWGLAGGTVWIEPLGKHLIGVAGGVSFGAPRERSFVLASYVNNVFYPTLSLNLFRFPELASYYGEDVLREDFIGGDVSLRWPLDWSDHPYVAERFSLRLRYAKVTPLNPEDFATLDELPRPEAGRQAELRLAFTRKKQRPYRDNVVHPLDGAGFRIKVKGAARLLGADTEFLRGDLMAFALVPTLGRQRLYVYGRAQAQTGRPLPQDYIGFRRTDGVQIDLPDIVPISFSDTDRVRGYRRFVVGNRVLFGSAEYRVPLLPDLQTRLLGLVSLGSTALAAFADGGLVWTDGTFDDAVRRLGVGVEVKNAVRLAGLLQVGHALGLAQPAADLGTGARYEVYYRIRAAVPF